jgi:hypothetical protein
MLCMRESGGVPNFLNTIDELYSSDDFSKDLVAMDALPSPLSALTKLESHCHNGF